jgi:hypothetical protein
MSSNIINNKSYGRSGVNLHDYQQSCDDFNWQQIDLNKIINIAYQAVDKHLNTAIQNKVALRWLGR